jgi:hypothetical protein
MPVLTDWKLEFDVDDVLRSQGADPSVVRERRPNLVAVAEQALADGMPLLEPCVTFQRLKVKSLRHERLTLENDRSLSGPVVAELLGPAEYVMALICTVGDSVERYASEMMQEDILMGFALDAVGSAAAEALANQACRVFEDDAVTRGMQTTVPLTPGMIDWPVAVGQPQIFALFDEDESGVILTEHGLMIPQKTLSMVLGLGRNVDATGRTCDYCAMNATCRYQTIHAAPTTD